MLALTLIKIALATLAAPRAELMNVPEFQGAQIELSSSHTMSQGMSILEVARTEADISYCSLESTTVRDLSAGQKLTIDAVENGHRESVLKTHTADGEDVIVSCINFGQADLDDVRQAFVPSARVISPHLTADVGESR